MTYVKFYYFICFLRLISSYYKVTCFSWLSHRSFVYPYVSMEAARWLLEKRSLRLIGTDTLSPDPFQIERRPSLFPIHILYLSQNRTIVENLRNLDKLPARGFRFHATPVKYVGASGTQVRAYAMTYDRQGSGGNIFHASVTMALCLVLARQFIL